MRRFFWIISLVSVHLFSCETNTGPGPVDCNQSDLNLTVSSFIDATGCNTSDGSFELIAIGGDGPYQYKLENGELQSSAQFTGLSAGNYTVFVMDNIGCERSTEVTIGSGGEVTITDVVATESGCGSANGTITVSASGGNNLMYKLDDGGYGVSNVFENLEAGNYTVTVKNDGGCEFSDQVKVSTGIPFSAIRSIINTNCTVSNCHSSAGSSLNWTIDANVVAMSEKIKIQTQNGNMPPPPNQELTVEQVNQIACWVDDGANLD